MIFSTAAVETISEHVAATLFESRRRKTSWHTASPPERRDEQSRSVVSKILKNFFSKKLKKLLFFLFHGQQGAPGHAEFV